jgi:hypothetical protein
MSHEILDNLCWYNPASEIHGVPWHNIGEPVTGLTVDYLRTTAINRTIAVVPVYGANGEPTGLYATRDDAGRYLASVSRDYAIAQPGEGLLGAASYLVNEHGAEVSCAAILRDGQREFLSLALPDSAFDVRENDSIKRYLNICNGHDGKLAWCFGDSAIRAVCANTVGAWLAEGTASKVRHKGDIRSGMASVLSAFTKRTRELSESCKRLAERSITSAECTDYIEAVTGESEADAREPKRGRPSLASRVWNLADDVTRQRGIKLSGVAGLPATAWDALNLVTQVISHETVAASPLDSMLFGTRQKLTNTANKVAAEMFLAA